MKSLFIFIMCCAIINTCIAQENNSNITIGTNHVIKSSILNQDRTLQIYTPNGYSESKEDYPVLYLLDGQRFFANGVAIQKSTIAPAQIPEMIVVGINSTPALRYTLFDDQSTKYTAFIRNEVISYIDANFRTTEERIIFGWEAAAFYVSEVILREKDMFSGAIVANGGSASEEIVKDFNADKEIYLYIANSRKDIFTISESDTFNDLLKKNNPKNLKWKYELFNDEVHQTIPYLAMYKGISYYYHNFPGLIFESIPAYIDAGGISYLKSYFKERANRFGGEGKIQNSTKNRLIWLAWHRNNFEYFNFFMEEFKDVLKTKRYASAYWQNRFGQFYLKHNDYQNAIKYFNAGLTKYPNSNFEEEMQQGMIEAKSRKSE